MTPNFLPTQTLLSGPGSGRAAWGKVWGVGGGVVQKGPPSGDSGAQVAMVPFLRQGQGNSGPEVGAGVWVGSDQFCKSPHIEGVLSECAHVEGSYLKGDKGERRGNTQKAPVLGGHLEFQPMSQKAELGMSRVEGAWCQLHSLSSYPPNQLPASPWAGARAPSPQGKLIKWVSGPVSGA